MADTDSWFDRVPGGYYKSKSQAQQPRSRYDSYGRSDEFDDREPYNDDRYNGRSNKRRDSHRSPHDRDNRRYSMNDGYARRSYEDERYDERPNDRYAGQDPRATDRYETDRGGPGLEAPVPTPAEAAAGGFAAGVAAAHEANNLPPDGGEKSTPYAGYVPYSDIYGNTQDQGARTEQPFSAPPRSSVGSPQPHSMNQISPPRRTSIAQEPSVRQMYDGNASYDDDKYADERYTRASRPRLSRLRSSSYDSYDSRYTPGRRDDRYDRRSQVVSRSRGKSTSQNEKAFDASARGLGYGAVGALAGGLLGSEFGGGTSTTIGAVLGGLGANMFEARERRRNNTRAQDFVQDNDMTPRRERREAGRRQDDASWTN